LVSGPGGEYPGSGGSGNCNPCRMFVGESNRFNFIASDGGGYVFNRWTGDCTPNNAGGECSVDTSGKNVYEITAYYTGPNLDYEVTLSNCLQTQAILSLNNSCENSGQICVVSANRRNDGTASSTPITVRVGNNDSNLTTPVPITISTDALPEPKSGTNLAPPSLAPDIERNSFTLSPTGADSASKDIRVDFPNPGTTNQSEVAWYKGLRVFYLNFERSGINKTYCAAVDYIDNRVTTQ